MKFKHVINFNNILQVAFTWIIFAKKLPNFFKATKNTFIQKDACKMLVKLEPIINFTCLCAAFTCPNALALNFCFPQQY